MEKKVIRGLSFLAIIVGMFLPWFDMGYGVTANIFDLAKLTAAFGQYSWLPFVLYFIIFLSAIGIIDALKESEGSTGRYLSGAILAFFAYLTFSGVVGLFSSIGYSVTVIGAIVGMIVGKVEKPYYAEQYDRSNEYRY